MLTGCTRTSQVLSFLSVARAAAAAAFLTFIAAACAQAPGPCPANAQDYWAAFRTSTLNNQPAAIADLTRFPFTVTGVIDAGSREMNRAEFMSRWPALLIEDPGMTPQSSTMEAFVRATPTLRPSFCNGSGNQLRVGLWVFQLGTEGWRFVQAFVED